MPKILVYITAKIIWIFLFWNTDLRKLNSVCMEESPHAYKDFLLFFLSIQKCCLTLDPRI